MSKLKQYEWQLQSVLHFCYVNFYKLLDRLVDKQTLFVLLNINLNQPNERNEIVCINFILEKFMKPSIKNLLQSKLFKIKETCFVECLQFETKLQKCKKQPSKSKKMKTTTFDIYEAIIIPYPKKQDF